MPSVARRPNKMGCSNVSGNPLFYGVVSRDAGVDATPQSRYL